MQQKDLQPQGSQGLAPRKVSRMNDRSARALLGVSLSATTGQIKRAYRRLALELHPDRGGDPAAFQRLVEAQQVLLAQPFPAQTSVLPAARWESAPSPTAQPRRTTDVGPTRRRSVTPQPVRSRQFGDVLAEKLAAA